MYKSRDLGVLAYTGGFTLWHYKTEDSEEEVKKEGYFDDADDMLRAGDMIILNTKDSHGFVFYASKRGERMEK